MTPPDPRPFLTTALRLGLIDERTAAGVDGALARARAQGQAVDVARACVHWKVLTPEQVEAVRRAMANGQHRRVLLLGAPAGSTSCPLHLERLGGTRAPAGSRGYVLWGVCASSACTASRRCTTTSAAT